MDQDATSAKAEHTGLSLRVIAGIYRRVFPYLKPQWVHILLWLGISMLVQPVNMFLGLVEVQILNDKVLVGEPLDASQASLFFLDETYVKDETLADNEQRTLSDEQRLTLFYRLLILIVLLQVPFAMIIPIVVVWYYQIWIAQRINQHLRVTMIESAEHLSLRYHSQARTGDTIYRVYQDSAMVTAVIENWILDPVSMAGTWTLAIVAVFLFSPLLGLACLLASVPLIWLMVWYTPRFQRASRAARETSSNLTSRIQEVFAAIRMLKANQSESTVLERFDRDSHIALDNAYWLRRGLILIGLATAVLIGGVVIVLDYLMAGWVIDEKTTSLVGSIAIIGFATWSFGAYQAAKSKVLESLGGWEVFRFLWLSFNDMAVGLDRAFYLLELDPEVVDAEDAAGMPEPIQDVTYDRVRFGYDAETPVLDGVNLSAHAGTITAVVGATGAGKSTLTTMLLRLYDPDEGVVSINGVDLRRIRIEDLRKNVAIALQENVLFASSVAENIAYAMEDASRDAVVDAAKIACADDFILDMDNGYDTELGERGGKLSTGQRQRLTIARAVIRDTPVLILDEPTASLDAETEQRVIANLAAWGKERVLFVITHRLSTIRSADQIAFLEDGQVVEVGGHEALMAIPDGRYRAFVEAETYGADGGAS
jgi:ATP-binding cassette subfamily B protein